MPLLSTNTGVAVGNKPSVLDLVIMQGASDTPLLNMIGKGKVSNILHSWIHDRYESPDANAQVEVSDVGATPDGGKTKTSNATQIFKTEAKVSYSQDAITTYGGTSALKHELNKRAKRHARDIEFALLGLNNGLSASEVDAGADTGVFSTYTERVANTTAPKMAGLFGFIPSASRINGAGGALTYDKFCDVLQKVWEQGGDPKKVFVGAGLKKVINEFSADSSFNSGLNINNGNSTFDPRIIKVATDFGVVDVMIHRDFTSANDLDKVVLAGDFSTCSFKTLIDTKLEDVNTSETATVKRYFTEGTLEVKNGDLIACGVNYA
jgi:hypothetical protein